jgi:hypothetical protein
MLDRHRARSPEKGDAVAQTHSPTLHPGHRSALARWWHSPLGHRFLVEAALMLTLFALYKLVRFSVRDQAAEAFANARAVIDFERAFWFFNEPDLQQLVLRHPVLVQALNHYYVWMHFPSTIACLAWLYVRHPAGYRSTRFVLVVTTALGLGIHVLYPLAPPRMLPGFGFVDTGVLFGPAAYGAGGAFDGLANQFAAMPSLHFGWALIVAIAVVRHARLRVRWIVVWHPVATMTAIVATANHYWIDGIVAGLLIASVYTTRALIRARGTSRPDAGTDRAAPERLGDPVTPRSS